MKQDTQIDAEFGYVAGQGRTSFPALLEEYRVLSEREAERSDIRLDIRYGEHPRQTFDLFPATIARAGSTLAYFHAGYWQSRDKSTFRFVAKAFNAAGHDVALVNYPLCPDVTLSQLVQAASAFLPALSLTSSSLVLAGHSAGAHIAVELAAGARPQDHVSAVVGISGVYDLRELVATSLNSKLRLDENSATQASPVLRVPLSMPPALFAVGEAETAAFRDQNRRMADAWRAGGNSCSEYVSAGDDHFWILRSLTDPEHPLHAAVLALLRRRTRGCCRQTSFSTQSGRI